MLKTTGLFEINNAQGISGKTDVTFLGLFVHLFFNFDRSLDKSDN